MKVIVYHAHYGCETGCCGHIVQLDDGREVFSFDHPRPKEDYKEYAKRLVKLEFGEKHVADLDWENCNISDD